MSNRPSLTKFAQEKGAAAPAEREQRGGRKAAEEPPVGLNFTVTPDFRREFKAVAVRHDKKLVELLREALDAWKRENEG